MTRTKTLDFDFEIKATDDDGEGSFEGLASPFGGTPDFYGDVVAPGAYADSLATHQRKGTMPLMLWGHDPDQPIGVWKHFYEDGRGLYGKGQLLKGVRKADEAAILVKAGAVRGLSIGYRVIEAVPDGKTTLLKKLDLLEVSIVAFPAAPRARVESIKSEFVTGWDAFARAVRDEELPPIKDFERLLRDAGLPKNVANHIASKGYAHFIRREAGEAKDASNADTLRDLRAAVAGFLPK
jgi:HK97 family phage prohead protease